MFLIDQCPLLCNTLTNRNRHTLHSHVYIYINTGMRMRKKKKNRKELTVCLEIFTRTKRRQRLKGMPSTVNSFRSCWRLFFFSPRRWASRSRVAIQQCCLLYMMTEPQFLHPSNYPSYNRLTASIVKKISYVFFSSSSLFSQQSQLWRDVEECGEKRKEKANDFLYNCRFKKEFTQPFAATTYRSWATSSFS